MYTIQEYFDRVKSWHKERNVGNIITFHPPGMSTIDAFEERTIKLFEMSEEERDAVETLFELFDFIRCEIFCDSNGNPDRIKISRSL